MACCWSRGTEQAFELERGDHIGIAPVTQFPCPLSIVGLVAWGQDHGAYIQGLLVGRLLVVDGMGLAGEHTLVTFRAKPTAQAALCLTQGLLLAQAQFDLTKVPHADGHRGLWGFDTGPGVHLPPLHHFGDLGVG